MELTEFHTKFDWHHWLACLRGKHGNGARRCAHQKGLDMVEALYKANMNRQAKQVEQIMYIGVHLK